MAPFAHLRERLATTSPLAPKPGFLETSVAVMLSPGAQGPEVLFIRRAVRASDPWSGHIGLPGGRREPGDENLLVTSIRETREEIGVALEPGLLIGVLDDLEPSTPAVPPLLIRPFVFGLDTRPETTTSEEVTASYWVALDSLHAAREMSTVTIRGKALKVPCFRVPELPDGLVVWGLTYRILNGLLPLLG